MSPTRGTEMYKPAPSRHKKTSIVRTRTGCRTCRERKKKCDEKQPACSTCVRLGKRCERFKAGFCFKNVSFESPESPLVNVDRSSERASEREASSTPAVDVTPDSATGAGANLPEIELELAGESFSDGPRTLPTGQIIQHASESSVEDDLYPTPHDSLLGELGDSEDGALPLLADHGWALAPSPFLALGLDNEAGILPGANLDFSSQRDMETQQLFHVVQNTLGLDNALTPSPNFTAIDLATEDSIVSFIPRQLSPFSGKSQHLVYTEFWDHQCLPALHPIFTHFPTLGNLPPVITDTMMALSAGRLSRLLPQRKSFEVPGIPGLSFRPDSGHKTSSQKYYYSALRRISDLVQQSSSDSVVTLAVLILFCYWETSMGSFRDFAIHSDGATKLIESQERTLLQQGTVGAGLMAAWVRAQMNNWWRRMHFSTPEFQRKQAPMSIEPDVEASLCTAGDRKALILVILCESLRIYSSAVVDLWDLLGRDITDEDGEPRAVSSDGDACLRPYASLMRLQSRKLSDWHTNVPLSELPITSFQVVKTVALDENTLTVEPLRFQSHDAAMNYAYYITSRIMQSSGVFHAYDDSAIEGVEQWILVLLRIAAGIDWEECVRLNTYSIGFSGLLLTCAVQSRRPAVGLWIQDWLEERQRTSHLEEGSFPVLQILQVLRAVNRERARGRDVLAVFQTVDDGGGEGKFHSYHSQTLTSVMVYARSREGKALSYSIQV